MSDPDRDSLDCGHGMAAVRFEAMTLIEVCAECGISVFVFTDEDEEGE